jgi:hypothetical protein
LMGGFWLSPLKSAVSTEFRIGASAAGWAQESPVAHSRHAMMKALFMAKGWKIKGISYLFYFDGSME